MLTFKIDKEKLTWLTACLVGAVVIGGTFLRLYRLEETMMFQGDQGRDAIVVKRIIKDGDLTLLGPVTSVGNMYLGPFYYYFMSPWLWLTYPNPVGPAYGVAITSSMFLLVFYWLAKEMTSRKVAFLSLFLLAFTPEAINFSRFSWNPNLAPLGGMALLYGLFKGVYEKRYRYLIVSFISMALLTQLHYFSLVLLPPFIAVLGWLLWKRVNERKQIFASIGVGIAIFLLSLLPLVVFDIRHDGLITNGFVEFFSDSDKPLAGGLLILETLKHLDGRLMLVLAELFSIPDGDWQKGLAYLSLILGVIGFFTLKPKQYSRHKVSLVLTALFLASTIAGAALYTSSVFIHYILFALPLAALWWGFVLARLLNTRIGILLLPLLLGFYLGFAAPLWHTFKPGSPPPSFYKSVGDNISVHASRSKPYNIALLANHRDYKGMNYRYFLEVSENPPQDTDDYENLEQLIVIDELGVSNVLSTQLFEIQTPNLRRLVNAFELYHGVTIYIFEDGETGQ